MKPYYDDGKEIVIYNCDCREQLALRVPKSKPDFDRPAVWDKF